MNTKQSRVWLIGQILLLLIFLIDVRPAGGKYFLRSRLPSISCDEPRCLWDSSQESVISAVKSCNLESELHQLTIEDNQAIML